jgi:hypothetical protein
MSLYLKLFLWYVVPPQSILRHVILLYVVLLEILFCVVLLPLYLVSSTSIHSTSTLPCVVYFNSFYFRRGDIRVSWVLVSSSRGGYKALLGCHCMISSVVLGGSWYGYVEGRGKDGLDGVH